MEGGNFISPQQDKFIAIDALPGKGKTESLIKLINNASKDERFLFITPYLDEVERIKKSCTRTFYEPSVEHGRGSKYRDIQNLFSRGQNIASTHALFMRFNETVEELIKAKGYTLILDEAITPVQTRKIKKHDFETAIRDNKIEIDNKKFIRWKEGGYAGDYFAWMKYFAERNCLMLSSDSDTGEDMEVTVWIYPIDILQAFNKVYIATYKIKGCLLHPYMTMHKINYQHMSMDNDYNIVSFDPLYEIEDRRKSKNLIDIYLGDNLNAVGSVENALSKSWFNDRNKKPLHKVLKDNLYNWYRYVNDAKSELSLWTTFSDYKNLLKGKGFTKGFIPHNMRATNEYRTRDVLAYCLNKYEVPTYLNIFPQDDKKGFQNELAISGLIQWLWRSALRDEKPIKLFIPSSRMRGLLMDWLDV